MVGRKELATTSRLLLLPPRPTAMFLVQVPASLGFNLLFIVLLDLDLGAPGSGRRLT